ncbi:hypothetical protein ABLT31_21655 [Ammoniphilus sp. 3BR4]
MDGLRKWVYPDAKTLVMVFILLFLLDQALAYRMSTVMSGNGHYREEVEGKNTFGVYLEQIKQDPYPKVLMLGNSVMFGSASKNDSETIPVFLAEYLNQGQGEEVHVYNLGIKGLGIADAYYLLGLLRDAQNGIDLIVYDLNIGWFNEPNLINRPFILEQYPMEQIDWKRLGVEPPEKDDTTDGWIKENILRHWRLFNYRDLVNNWIFGRNATVMVEDQARYTFKPSSKEEDQEIYLPWYEKNWEAKYQGDWKIGSISYTDEQWKYFQFLLALMNDISRESLVFFTPQNDVLLKRYNKLDEAGLEEAKQKLAQVAEEGHVQFFDYEELLPDRLFSDSIHPMPAGNRIIAKQLFEDIQQMGVFSDQ